MMQLTLAFKPGLTHEFKSLRAVTQAAVLRTKGGIAAIAPAVDMSPSQLGRKLQANPDDPHRTLDVDDWCAVVDELAQQGDYTPIYWLLERLHLGGDQQRSVAVAQLASLMPRITELLEAAQGAPSTKVRRR